MLHLLNGQIDLVVLSWFALTSNPMAMSYVHGTKSPGGTLRTRSMSVIAGLFLHTQQSMCLEAARAMALGWETMKGGQGQSRMFRVQDQLSFLTFHFQVRSDSGMEGESYSTTGLPT